MGTSEICDENLYSCYFQFMFDHLLFFLVADTQHYVRGFDRPSVRCSPTGPGASRSKFPAGLSELGADFYIILIDRDRRAGAHEVAVSVNVVDTSNRGPELGRLAVR